MTPPSPNSPSRPDPECSGWMPANSADAGCWCAQFTFTDDKFGDPLGLAKVGADLSVMVAAPHCSEAAGR